MNEYIIYFLVWALLIVMLSVFIRFMVVKIDRTELKESKNSLFTMLMLVGIPATLILLITPIIVIGGDKYLQAEYKLMFIILALITITAVYYIQTRRKIK